MRKYERTHLRTATLAQPATEQSPARCNEMRHAPPRTKMKSVSLADRTVLKNHFIYPFSYMQHFNLVFDLNIDFLFVNLELVDDQAIIAR
jgi:hypothetical protein